MPVDDSLPDCVFVEDTAVFLGKNNVIITIPGAISRQPEAKEVHRKQFMKLKLCKTPISFCGRVGAQIIRHNVPQSA